MLSDIFTSLTSFSLVDFIFINLIITVVVLGYLVIFFEKHIPPFIAQTFRYGKHAFKGKADTLVSKMEVPKSWFRHFYLYALVWSIFLWTVTFNAYFRGVAPPRLLITFLDVVCGKGREVKTSPTTTFIALTLLTVQCARRFYETHFVQVFSSHNKINLSQYIVGYLHYFGALTVIVAKAENFTSSDIFYRSEFSVFDFVLAAPFVVLFLYAWYQQFQSNLILANLRKKDGRVVTEKHLLPVGGFFELVSSPHMFFEIVMYAAYFAILYQNISALYVFVWVLSNQTENAWLTHMWYKNQYKNYPVQRRAVFPRLF